MKASCLLRPGISCGLFVALLAISCANTDSEAALAEDLGRCDSAEEEARWRDGRVDLFALGTYIGSDEWVTIDTSAAEIVDAPPGQVNHGRSFAIRDNSGTSFGVRDDSIPSLRRAIAAHDEIHAALLPDDQIIAMYVESAEGTASFIGDCARWALTDRVESFVAFGVEDGILDESLSQPAAFLQNLRIEGAGGVAAQALGFD